MSAENKKEQQRIIGRWTIGATLGKGGYSWVKRGQDIKTGKIVALKFMEKADVSWVKEQAKQVETEIEALKNIRHQNVMKLYAYNLNAQYPLASGQSASEDTHGHSSGAKDNNNNSKDQKYIDTILLVLEYAPGGELFDILYYTSALEETVARTYFKQIVNGLEACHNANVVHRDLKPQNLLLDAKYNLKITDFGLSKIIQSDADAIMKTTYVGTRGYQAPELLRNQKYDLKCDIFSIGVILFILLAGYPPFEQASQNDKWFKPLQKADTKNKASPKDMQDQYVTKFWNYHKNAAFIKNSKDGGAAAKELLTCMLWNDPTKRADMNYIKSHQWFKGATLKQKDLINEIRDRHRKAEKKRRQDVRKMKDLAQSLNPQRPIPGIEKAVLKDFPEDLPEDLFGEYTFVEKERKWYDIYNFIEEAITGQKGQGEAKFDFEKGILKCTMNVAEKIRTPIDDDNKENGPKIIEKKIEFDVQVFRSRVWKQRFEENKEELAEEGAEEVLICRVSRTGGDPLTYNKIMKDFMLLHCSTIIKGLPKWARNMEKQLEDNDNKQENDKQEEEDDYASVLAKDSNIFTAVAVKN